MSVSLKKPSQAIREITPEHLIDEEETIVKPVRSASKSLKIEVVEDKIKQLPQVAETTMDKHKEQKVEKIGKYSGLTRSDWIEIIIKSALVCGVFGFALYGFILPMANDFSGIASDISYQEAAIKSVYDGIIVDKSIENPRSNAFRTTNTEYRLYISVDYYVDGEKKTTKKYFSVSESTYLAYDVGDYFNSHNFTFSDGQ